MNVKTKIAAAALNDAIVTLQQLQQRKKQRTGTYTNFNNGMKINAPMHMGSERQKVTN